VSVRQASQKILSCRIGGASVAETEGYATFRACDEPSDDCDVVKEEVKV